ncbi:AfsR/SARP family transcriptional regulator [Streptomyces sparsus]
MLSWQVLGALRATADGRDVTPTPPKVRQLLALLLARRNSVVSLTAIAGELWSGEPPRTATGTVQTYAYQLRKALQAGASATAGNPLGTHAHGYVLSVAPGKCDAEEFTLLTVQGRAALREGDPDTAAVLLRRALDMWGGPPFADVVQGPALRGYASRMEELHLQAQELRITAELRRGRHRELVGELKELVCVHPMHEWFQGTLIITLERCGRRSEALQVYQRLREVLRDELGLDPSPVLQRIRHHVLTDRVSDADLDLLPG